MFVLSEIDPDDHEMKARLDAFTYDADEVSYVVMRFDAMITIKI